VNERLGELGEQIFTQSGPVVNIDPLQTWNRGYQPLK
jgi:hypothetical protein